MIGFLDLIAFLACGPYAIAIITDITFSQYPFSTIQFYVFDIHRQVGRRSIKCYEKDISSHFEVEISKHSRKFNISFEWRIQFPTKLYVFSCKDFMN